MHTSYHILDFVQQEKTTFPMEQPVCRLPILTLPCPLIPYRGVLSHQGTSGYDIEQKSLNIPSPASKD